MSNVLPLFTYPNDLVFTTLEANDETTLEETYYTDRKGLEYRIYVSSDECGKEWVISSEEMFEVYDTNEEFVRAFLDIQKRR